MTKIVIKVKRIKLIHTNERKNTKKEPIPAPKCPKEKNAVVYIDIRRDLVKLSLCEGWAEGNTLCTDKTVQNEIKHQYDLVIIALNSYDIFL